MTLWIDSGGDEQNGARAIADLKRICPDPNLTVDWGRPGAGRVAGGLVHYDNPSVLDEYCYRVYRIVQSPVAVVIRPTNPGVTVNFDFLGDRMPMNEYIGFTWWKGLPSITPMPTVINVLYDPTDDVGRGYWELDINEEPIRLRSDVILMHELGHVGETLDGVDHTGHDDEQTEVGAIAVENAYRRSRGLPERWGHEGGRDLRSKLGGITGGDCFIATAAYGSELEPEVQVLREFRDDVLRQTRSGADFFEEYWSHYYQLSPVIVEMMHENPEVREMVRWSLVAPIVGFLRMAKAFPRTSTHELPEPWRGFVERMREEFEVWAEHLPRPEAFDDRPPQEAAEELRVVVDHLIFRDEERADYLARLQAAGQLPLRADVGTRVDVARLLRGLGTDASVVTRITGVGHGEATP
jgi:hypothetical protein